jgi:hypothetical protein
MSQPRKPGQEARIEELELSRETVQDLSDRDAEQVKGGMMAQTRRCQPTDRLTCSGACV